MDSFKNNSEDLSWDMVGTLVDTTSERYHEDMDWVSSNRGKLAKFEGTWIAVYNKTVIASDTNPKEAEKKALNLLGGNPSDPPFMRFLEKSLVIY